MTSSEGHRPAGQSGVAAEPGNEPGQRQNGAANGDPLDPWFAPGPKAAGPVGAGAPADWRTGQGDGDMLEPDTAQWFLPTGRAGLLPDSVTVADDADEARERRPSEAASPETPGPPGASGAPPWAAEASASSADSPPPWENGPWPGPASQRRSRPAAQPGGPGRAGEVRPGERRRPGETGDAGGGLWPARTVLVAGLVPLVIPGLVAGALTLRRSQAGDPARRAGVLALAASLAWAVIIVVIVVATAGGSAPGCTYPAAVHQAYARALSDLSGHAATSVQAADLSVAVGKANASAAGTGVLAVRTALFALAGDLEVARADVTAHRIVPAALMAHLEADGTALTQACPS